LRFGDLPIAAGAGSALPSAGEGSHAGVPRLRGLGCPFAAAAEGVVDVKIVWLFLATNGSVAEEAAAATKRTVVSRRRPVFAQSDRRARLSP
jgi:hypothetical protein